MRPLIVCHLCHRHAFESEPACPFCGGPLATPPPTPAPLRRLTRAAIFYGAAALAGCAEPGVGVRASEPAEVAPIMEPVLVEATQPAPPPGEAPFTGPVEPEPLEEPAAIARAERSHAEQRKNPPPVATRPPPHWIRDRLMMPYGAPPVDVDELV